MTQCRRPTHISAPSGPYRQPAGFPQPVGCRTACLSVNSSSLLSSTYCWRTNAITLGHYYGTWSVSSAAAGDSSVLETAVTGALQACQPAGTGRAVSLEGVSCSAGSFLTPLAAEHSATDRFGGFIRLVEEFIFGLCRWTQLLQTAAIGPAASELFSRQLIGAFGCQTFCNRLHQRLDKT